jgi:hypothetical protein
MHERNLFSADARYVQAIPFLVALAVGVLVIADPYVSTQITRYIPVSVTQHTGVRIPYLFTSLLVLVGASCVAFFFAVKKIIRLDTGKVFVIMYLVGVHTIALSPNTKINGAKLVLLMFVFIFLLSRLVDNKNLRITPIDFLSFCLMASLILSFINGKSAQPLITITTSFLLMALSFLLINYCSRLEMLNFIVKWFIIITLISAVYGIFQEAIYYGYKVPLVGFISQKEMRFGFEETSLGTLLRIPALTGSYALLMYFLASSLILILNILFYKSLDFRKKLKLFSAAVIISIAILLTFSRFTLVALAIVIPLNIIVRWWKYIIHIIAGIVLVMCIVYIVGFFYKDMYVEMYQIVVKETQWGEFRIRMQLDKEGLYGFLNQHTFIGTGGGLAGQYAGHFHRWGAHNAYIRVADDAGLFGLLSYTLLTIYSLIKVIIINLRAHRHEDLYIARGLLFVLLAILIMVQFDSVYLGAVLWFFMGVIKSAEIVFNTQGDGAFQTETINGD